MSCQRYREMAVNASEFHFINEELAGQVWLPYYQARKTPQTRILKSCLELQNCALKHLLNQ